MTDIKPLDKQDCALVIRKSDDENSTIEFYVGDPESFGSDTGIDIGAGILLGCAIKVKNGVSDWVDELLTYVMENPESIAMMFSKEDASEDASEDAQSTETT